MWNRMTDQEFNTLLIEAIKKHGPKLGITPVDKLTIKALKTCTAEGSEVFLLLFCSQKDGEAA